MHSPINHRSVVPILVILIVTFLAIGASAQDNDRDKHNPVVGSWHVTVSFDDGRPDVRALWTFDSDQTFTIGGSWPKLRSFSGGDIHNRSPDEQSSTNDH